MYFNKIVSGFITVFAVSLLVTVGVTFLWDLVFRGVAIIDWKTSFRFATLLGIIVPVITLRRRLKP
jgi:hypothetical protein